MTIKWKAPIDDGGMPITSYNIEARTTGGDWQTWEMLDNPSTRAVVQKLQKGMEYQFRYDTFFETSTYSVCLFCNYIMNMQEIE